MLDNEILSDFVLESKQIVDEILEILEEAEGDFSKVSTLEQYGQKVDRIMGAAKSVAMMAPEDHPIHWVADYAAVCKSVGYKTSQIKDNKDFYDICVGLLLDATENLAELMDHLDQTVQDLRARVPEAFLTRLKWVAEKFSADFRMSVDAGPKAAGDGKMGQDQIDELMKKLGL